jgi:hypothetical protein
MVPSGCLVGNPEVPNHPNMSRWVAAWSYGDRENLVRWSDAFPIPTTQ